MRAPEHRFSRLHHQGCNLPLCWCTNHDCSPTLMPTVLFLFFYRYSICRHVSAATGLPQCLRDDIFCCYARTKGLLPLLSPHSPNIAEQATERHLPDVCYVVTGAYHESEIIVWDYQRAYLCRACVLADHFQGIALMGWHPWMSLDPGGGQSGS